MIRIFLGVVVSLCAFISPYIESQCVADTPQLKSPHAIVTLISDTNGYTPDAVIKLGFYFQLDPEWHVYWKNPGDSGSAPKFVFEPHEMLSPGEIIWPAPERIPLSHLLNYGYPGEVLLPFPVSIGTDAHGPQTLKVHGEWLVCKEDCIPGEGDFSITLEEKNKVIPSQYADLFQRFMAKAPIPYMIPGLTASFSDEQVTFLIPEDLGQEVSFIPETMGIVQNIASQNVSVENERTRIQIPRARSKKEPSEISGILEVGEKRSAVSFQVVHALTQSDNDLFGTLKILIFAFLGGLILNLMPCVFPVIGIKVLSLIEESQMRGRSRTMYVMTYAAGVIASLWVLFGAVIVARSFGTELGWGFQLQQPIFVGCLSLLFLLLGFNFLGFLEVSAPIRMATTAERHYLIESFLSGLLTTVVATPCTAPFMGTSIAYALQTDLISGFGVFTALGFGLACPYIFFAIFPSLLSVLPKPGHWMQIFKRFLAFPLFGASIWLLWIVGQQTGSNGMTRVLFAALLLSIGAWIKHDFGSITATPSSRIIAKLCFLTTLGYSLFVLSHLETVETGSPSGKYIDSYNQQWEPYHKGITDELLNAGSTVYLDLTASWCVTCQVNKAVVFGSKEVRDYVAQHRIVLVRGDWTNQDPVVTEVIQSYGKAGVPLNILFKPGKPPVIFPTVLTASMVLDEMQRAP